MLFRSPRAKLLGIPTSAFGLCLYAGLAVGLLRGWPPAWLFALTVPAAAMSAFLAYSLLSNKRECRICWMGHLANGTLLVVMASRWLNA